MKQLENRIIEHTDQLPELKGDVGREVARRVAEWLKATEPDETCTVRTAGVLVMVRKVDTDLEFIVTRPSFQMDDSASGDSLFSHHGGPSIIQPGTSATRIAIPLSKILEGD